MSTAFIDPNDTSPARTPTALTDPEQRTTPELSTVSSESQRPQSQARALPFVSLATGSRRAIALVLFVVGLVMSYSITEMVPIGWVLLVTAGLMVVKVGSVQTSHPVERIMMRVILGGAKFIGAATLATLFLWPPLDKVSKQAAIEKGQEQQRATDGARAAAAAAATEQQRVRQEKEAQNRAAAEQAAREFDANRRRFEADLAAIRLEIKKNDWGAATVRANVLDGQLHDLIESDFAEKAVPSFAKFKSEFVDVQQTLQAHRAQAAAAEAKRDRAIESADPTIDIEVVRSSWSKGGFGVVAEWSVTLKNTSALVTYADIEYATQYSAPSGTALGKGAGRILDILAPGKTRTFNINDGFINSQAGRASFRITGAEKRK